MQAVEMQAVLLCVANADAGRAYRVKATENRERVIGQGEAHLVLVRLGSVSVDDFREVVAFVKA